MKFFIGEAFGDSTKIPNLRTMLVMFCHPAQHPQTVCFFLN